jgi:hypothetical protein
MVWFANFALKETLSLAYRLEYFDAKDATAGLGLLAGTSVVGTFIIKL